MLVGFRSAGHAVFIAAGLAIARLCAFACGGRTGLAIGRSRLAVARLTVAVAGLTVAVPIFRATVATFLCGLGQSFQVGLILSELLRGEDGLHLCGFAYLYFLTDTGFACGDGLPAAL